MTQSVQEVVLPTKKYGALAVRVLRDNVVICRVIKPTWMSDSDFEPELGSSSWSPLRLNRSSVEFAKSHLHSYLGVH